ncbi:MAG: urease accessory protein UreD [Gammaproteobacteria bacterium]|nr:urease accessory protein UreD [Gammaproteobacteria bacterium]
MLAVKPENCEPEWKAKLSLWFKNKNEKTVLAQREHYGPLRVQRPFYPEGSVCHVYLIHPPGGLVGGDKLEINMTLDEGSHVLATTPSAGKFYRSGLLKAVQKQRFKVADNCFLEWFPQETIFFNACRSELVTEIELSERAMFCGWEINCLGRPAAGEKYTEGKIIQQMRVYREGSPLYLETNSLEGNSDLLRARCGLNNNTVFGTLLATQIDKEARDVLQDVWHNKTEKSISVTLINDLLVCRYLGNSAEQAKEYFTQIWSVVRDKQKKLKTCVPRIWST